MSDVPFSPCAPIAVTCSFVIAGGTTYTASTQVEFEIQVIAPAGGTTNSATSTNIARTRRGRNGFGMACVNPRVARGSLGDEWRPR